MAWFKVDDGFYTSRKVLSIPRRQRFAAVGLWTMAGNWCARELMDGHVPTYVLEEIGATETLIRALTSARLWLDHRSTEARPSLDRSSTEARPTLEQLSDGIEFINWSEYQPTRAQVEAERARTAERQRNYRARQAGETSESPVSNAVSNAVSNTVSHGVSHAAPSRPVPTRPTKKTPSSKTPVAAAPEFDEFWAAYPRKNDKGKARPAWAKAVKKADPQRIIQAASQYAKAVDRREGGKYIKLPTSWLNAESWDDEAPSARHAPARRPELEWMYNQ